MRVHRSAALAAELDRQVHVEDRHEAGGAEQNGVGQQAAALTGDEGLAGHVLAADADEQGGQLQPQVLEELLTAEERQGELAEERGCGRTLRRPAVATGGGRRKWMA